MKITHLKRFSGRELRHDFYPLFINLKGKPTKGHYFSFEIKACPIGSSARQNPTHHPQKTLPQTKRPP